MEPTLKGTLSQEFTEGFFHESSSTWPSIVKWAPFKTFFKFTNIFSTPCATHWRDWLRWQIYCQHRWHQQQIYWRCQRYQRSHHGVTKRCCLSWLTNSAFVYEPKCGSEGGVAGSQPMNTAVHRSPNKLWRSNSIFNRHTFPEIYIDRG